MWPLGSSVSPTGRLPGASELGRVRVSLSGGGGFRQGHRGGVRQAKRLAEGGAAEPGQPLRPPLPRRTQDQARVSSSSNMSCTNVFHVALICTGHKLDVLLTCGFPQLSLLLHQFTSIKNLLSHEGNASMRNNIDKITSFQHADG